MCFGRSCAESALAPSGLNASNGESAQSSRLELGGPASCPHFSSACAHRLCKADTTQAGRTQPAQLWPPSCAAVSAPAVSAGRCVRTAAAALMRTQLRLRRCTMHCAAAAAAQLCRPQSGAISKGTTTYAVVHCLNNIASVIYKSQKKILEEVEFSNLQTNHT